MQSVEAEGSTLDDAIARALQLLGAPRERVEIEILANATRGLFGFGGKRARVRASLRRSLTEVAAAPALDAAPLPMPAAPPPAERRREERRGNARSAAERSSQQRRPRPRRPRSDVQPAAVRGHEDVPPTPAALDRARAVLSEIVQLCGVEATVQAAGSRLVIDGDTSGVMIGRRGSTLDALEYVVNRAVGHDDERSGHVEIDANDYRGRRRAALEALARRMAERARSKGKPVTLNPLSPRERRIVHLALQDDPTLMTRSAGSGFYRRLVIAPTSRS
jgi:spoIIIJ-associated protein